MFRSLEYMWYRILFIISHLGADCCSSNAPFQIEIWLEKTANFDELMAAAAEERDVGDGEEQSWDEFGF